MYHWCTSSSGLWGNVFSFAFYMSCSSRTETLSQASCMAMCVPWPGLAMWLAAAGSCCTQASNPKGLLSCTVNTRTGFHARHVGRDIVWLLTPFAPLHPRRRGCMAARHPNLSQWELTPVWPASHLEQSGFGSQPVGGGRRRQPSQWPSFTCALLHKSRVCVAFK